MLEMWHPIVNASPVYYCMLCGYVVTNWLVHCSVLKHCVEYLVICLYLFLLFLTCLVCIVLYWQMAVIKHEISTVSVIMHLYTIAVCSLQNGAAVLHTGIVWQGNVQNCTNISQREGWFFVCKFPFSLALLSWDLLLDNCSDSKLSVIKMDNYRCLRWKLAKAVWPTLCRFCVREADCLWLWMLSLPSTLVRFCNFGVCHFFFHSK